MSSVLAEILEANRQYSATFSLEGLKAHANRGLGLLTCIDTRIDPLQILGLKPGDAKIFRNAGARVTPDALRSLSIASHLLNVDHILVIAHTHCAMAGSNDELRARMLAQKHHASSIRDLELMACEGDPYGALAGDVVLLRESGLLAPGTSVTALKYDVDTGLLQQLDY